MIRIVKDNNNFYIQRMSPGKTKEYVLVNLEPASEKL